MAEPKYTLDKIEAILVKGDMRGVEFQFKLLSLLLIYYELLKSKIIDRTKSFLSDKFSIDDNGEIVTEPSDKYLDLIRGKGEFRACRDYHLRLGAITTDDDLLIDKFSAERNRCAHEVLKILLDDRATEIDFELLFGGVALFNKIDNWWIVKFEMEIDPDFLPEGADREKAEKGAASLQAIILANLIAKLFNLDDLKKSSDT
ncbi:MAG: hypothetical protein NTU64_09710 [Hyphomicrobiales bacterium]|nr:hypothetical protein [Hyphomicrobiales bacterium]